MNYSFWRLTKICKTSINTTISDDVLSILRIVALILTQINIFLLNNIIINNLYI